MEVIGQGALPGVISHGKPYTGDGIPKKEATWILEELWKLKEEHKLHREVIEQRTINLTEMGQALSADIVCVRAGINAIRAPEIPIVTSINRTFLLHLLDEERAAYTLPWYKRIFRLFSLRRQIKRTKNQLLLSLLILNLEQK